MTMEKPNELFLIMSCDDFRYCLFRVCEPGSNEEEDIIYSLDEPIVKLHNGSCPDGMSSAVIGRRIFMVGGYHAHSVNNPFRLSNETIIIDTDSKTYARGPSLISPKPDPFLFTVGSKLFALSCDIASGSSNRFVGPEPMFEVLDTNNLESGWRPLPPVPRIYISQQHTLYPIVACVGLSTGIFISVEDAGTYAFDLVSELWSHVSAHVLPFVDQAVSMPPDLTTTVPPSVCFASSPIGECYAFQTSYETGVDGKRLFKCDAIELDSSLLDLSTPLPPQELHYQWPLIACGSLIYLIDSGIDNPDANNTNVGNRYIKMQVCNVGISKGQLLRSGDEQESGTMVENIGHGDEEKSESMVENIGHAYEEKSEAMVENIGEFPKRFEKKVKYDWSSGDSIRKCARSEEKRDCTSSEQKSEFEVDEERAEEAQVEDIGTLLKVGTSTRKRGKNKQIDETLDETLELKLNPIWRRSFFGGPMVDIGQHVYAAFAIKS